MEDDAEEDASLDELEVAADELSLFFSDDELPEFSDEDLFELPSEEDFLA